MVGQSKVVGLTVRFVDGGPTEEAVHAAHRCIARARLKTPIMVTITWSAATVREVRIALANGAELSAQGPGLMAAMQRACEHAVSLQMASDLDRHRWCHGTAPARC